MRLGRDDGRVLELAVEPRDLRAERVALADDLLRQARDAAVEANFTIRTLDKPLGEVSKRAWGLHNAFDTLTDATNREFYDKPCRPVFGACCVRDAPDGGMRITCGS